MQKLLIFRQSSYPFCGIEIFPVQLTHFVSIPLQPIRFQSTTQYEYKASSHNLTYQGSQSYNLLGAKSTANCV